MTSLPARTFLFADRGLLREGFAADILVFDPAKVKDLSTYANPQRPSYACGKEGGPLLCTWPRGGELSLPFVYSNEVWTGIEYQVASHLMRLGLVREGLEIVRVCRERYDGRVRNPFNEYECGHCGEGLVIHQALPAGSDPEALAALATTLLRHTTELGDAARLGPLTTAVLDFGPGPGS